MARKIGDIGMKIGFRTDKRAAGMPVFRVKFTNLHKTLFRDRFDLILSLVFARRPFIMDIIVDEQHARSIVNDVVESLEFTLASLKYPEE